MSSDNEVDLFAEKQDFQIKESLKVQALEGGRAKEFLGSDGYQWFNNFVLTPLQDEAIEILKKAKTDEDRVKAQQMLLAADKPRQILDHLVRQGEAAQLQLISTHQNGG